MSLAALGNALLSSAGLAVLLSNTVGLTVSLS